MEDHIIKGFRDLRVYRNLYQAMKVVLTDVIPNLPAEERFDLKDQMRRCCKACPALLAEGFAKRYQKQNWRKYIDDTIGECNEMIHHLSVCVDIYHNHVNSDTCQELINEYDSNCKQLTSLKNVWQNYHNNKG